MLSDKSATPVLQQAIENTRRDGTAVTIITTIKMINLALNDLLLNYKTGCSGVQRQVG